jgi:hypothetical protein
MELDPGTFLLQWAAGGLLFAWVTTRRREVSLGYGWLLRIVYGLMALGGGAILVNDDRELAAVSAFACAAGAAIGLYASVMRRRAGVSGREAMRAARRAKVAAMVGRDVGIASATDDRGPEFPPVLDLIAAAVGFAGLFAAAEFAGGPYVLAAVRLLAGAAFLGAVSDAMLLGHWYLVQPGLPRDAIRELVMWTGAIWPLEVAAFLWPTGMVQVFNGVVDDGYDGILGWMWAVCAATTIGLVVMTWYALKERSYSAVMAATGLLYLAILTAFGVDLVARAVLAP